MLVGVEGCCHGELDRIYRSVETFQSRTGRKLDLLIICGDFQAVRNCQDLKCMAVPPKYYSMGTFYQYYSGAKHAPCLTLVIGGNHEASNHMQELPYGGWLAPYIYYLGYASCVTVGTLRVCGLSGIYKGHDYLRGRCERVPYDSSTLRSVYHVRVLDVFRLKQLKSQKIDIFISHDWPRGIWNHGNVEDLLRRKPFFKSDIDSYKLGSRPCEELLNEIRPHFWFSAHLHVKFAAIVSHTSNAKERDGLSTSAEDGTGQRLEESPEILECTRFLALDKCLPKRSYLQILDLPNHSAGDLKYDVHWLTILRLTNHLINVTNGNQYMPSSLSGQRYDFQPSQQETHETLQLCDYNLRVPHNFQPTVHVYDGCKNIRSAEQPAHPVFNAQTRSFCTKLRITDPMQLLCGNVSCDVNRDEIPLGDVSDDEYKDGGECLDVTRDWEMTFDPDVSCLSGASFDESSIVVDRHGSFAGDSLDFSADSMSPGAQNPSIVSTIDCVVSSVLSSDQHKPSDQPLHQPQHKPNDQPNDQPLHQPNDQPLHQPNDQPLHQPNDQPQHKPNDQPLHQPNDQPLHQPNEKVDISKRVFKRRNSLIYDGS